MNRRVTTVLLFLVAVVCLRLAWAEIVVCPACGHENAPEAEICTHCRARLPLSELRKKALAETLKPGAISGETVEAEIGQAQKRLDAGDGEVARFFLRNALALDLLADPGRKADRGDRIRDLLTKCDRRREIVQRKCPACGGSGKRMMKMIPMGGKGPAMEMEGGACERCGGKGTVPGRERISERKFAIGRAMNEYRRIQQSRKYMPVGEAWVPADVEGTLSLKDKVVLRRTTAAPCAACMGIGRTECTKCNGAGNLKCPNSGCDRGKVRKTVRQELTRTNLTLTETCPDCGGEGMVKCETCGTEGSVVCAGCNGSGERAACVRCAGEGMVPCARCKGTGRNRDAPCVECRGLGSVLCSSCSGDGRKR